MNQMILIFQNFSLLLIIQIIAGALKFELSAIHFWNQISI